MGNCTCTNQPSLTTIQCIIQRIRKVYEKIVSEVKQHLAEYRIGWVTVPVVTSQAQLLYIALSK